MKKILVVLSLTLAIMNVQAQEVVTLYNYLHVYPKDLGNFPSKPVNVINAINNNGDFGYDSWRLPTREEMALIAANEDKIQGLGEGVYMTSDGQSSGNVRLVATVGKTVAEKEKEMEDARRREEARQTSDEGVWMNGVVWATRNVGNNGTFVNAPRDYGNYYSWTDAIQACPAGWRLPTEEEFRVLYSGEKSLVRTNNGLLIGNSLFLPTPVKGDTGWKASYWGLNGEDGRSGYLYFTLEIEVPINGNGRITTDSRNFREQCLVRCVKK